MRYLVLGLNRFGFVLARYWVRSEQGLWRAKAELSQDWMVVRMDVIELAKESEGGDEAMRARLGAQELAS